LVAANTEIVNFAALNSPELDILNAPQWPRLASDLPEALFRVQPAPLGTKLRDVCEKISTEDSSSSSECPNELWLILDLESPKWLTYSKFTLRISWPASFPADFLIETFTPHQLASKLSLPNLGSISDPSLPLTRRQYARIRVVDTGFTTPRAKSISPHAVPFAVRLEPLLFGVIPMTVVPTLMFLVPVVAIAAALAL
ncbi:hypothetical protein C8Q75DRAFT_704067, partial [Abortiporus biennis]